MICNSKLLFDNVIDVKIPPAITSVTLFWNTIEINIENNNSKKKLPTH